MILFASDFGLAGPYVGQVHAILARWAPGIPVIDLIHDLPPFRPAGAGCLIRAVVESLAAASRTRERTVGDVVLAVVDPGVGTDRDPIIVEAGGTRFVGPDNGLFASVCRTGAAAAWRIEWRPDHLSDSFHGRDLFAPVAARLARGQPVDRAPTDITDLVGFEQSGSMPEVIYLDRYGNAMIGLEARGVADDSVVSIGNHRLRRAKTFGEVAVGSGFWYANSIGLVEIAINQGSAATRYDLAVGTPVQISG